MRFRSASLATLAYRVALTLSSGPSGQNEVIGTADAMLGIPQTERDSGADDGTDGERLRGCEDLAGNEIVARVLVVGGIQNTR